MLYLAGLPSALVATYVVLQSTLGSIYKALAAPAAQASTDPSPEPEAQPPVAPDAQFKVRLLHASMRCALGNTAHTVVEALAGGRRAGVDPVLRDPRDFPVYAARVGTLDAGRITDLRAALVAFDSSITWNDENVRTLALLDDVMMEAYQAVDTHAESHPNAVRHLPPRLHLVTLIPTHWNGSTRDTVERWLHTQSKLRKSGSPGSNIVMASSAPHTAFIEVDRIITALNHDDSADFHIIAAAQSDLDTRLIADYDANGAMFTGARQHAAILGEAATALVLRSITKPVTDGNATAPSPPDAQVHLARASFGQLSLPIDSDSKPEPKTLGLIAENTLAAAAVKGEQIRVLYADAGSHATRNGELSQFAFQHFPTLIQPRECAPLDGGCGITGAAGALLTIALAGHHVKHTQTAALAATLADSQERAALIAVPGTQAFNET